ncbi:stabilizer of axonemal microtubules 1 [Anopheles ziemanni]|uniref:stabilizer of axonemal microtubules 1 n=1 Tax=Anopheles coustani TaxID=139045 RepID=UPI00265A3266|nr:stabilizer of axonemal microtubules 1 [Anopheles coustani]XP_058169403.1 stabilizer of axonemal microtubules 1 [Anopheles ziemanni]
MECDGVGAAQQSLVEDTTACYDEGVPLAPQVPCSPIIQGEPEPDQCDELCVDQQNCSQPCVEPGPTVIDQRTAEMPQCCNCACGRPGCVPTKRVRYVQPPKRESCKPIATYKAPEVQFGGDSVYKTSYNPDPQLVINARPLPIKPQSHLVPNPGCVENTTVTAMSYPGYNNIERAQPIVPVGNQLIQSGPLQEVTTNRHDYVAKTTPKRYKIVPAGHMHVHSAPFEKQTVNKLSYSCPNMASFEPARSCKPLREYERPEIPMQSDTTTKLSYGPICPPPKEDVPWARRACYQPPNVAMDNETTYKKSYISSHCANERAKMVLPYNNLAVPAGSGFESKTVYKDSYHSAPCGERPPAIRPVVQLRVPNTKLEDDTVYKTSFATHCHAERPAPILPRPAPLIGDGPMQEMTTQRHDFVCKGHAKREPIVPQGSLAIPTGRLESATSNRLSFPANKENVVPTKSCKPVRVYKRPEEPMESDTTQKLSYMPVCPPPKEHYPWAQRVRFQAPNQPMESDTVQKLSYPPPGQYIEETGPSDGGLACCQSCNPAAMNCCGNMDTSCSGVSYPRAGIVK